MIADGAPEIWKATRELWPHALEQRCTVHALRNVTGKLPERHHAERSMHRKRIRITNLLERTFVEVRRRTKVIGRFPGETSALSLIWAVLELSSRGWRGVKMNP